MTDFSIQNHGSIFLIHPHIEGAREWIAEHIDPDQSQTFGGGLVVEPRYVSDLVAGMESDGLVVS
jgi:hypothetical protein